MAKPRKPKSLEVPGHYGDPGAERDALRERCGLVDRSWVSRLELCGADRARFLNGLVTSDVENLEPGTGIYGFFTDLKGRVMADVWVMALEDRFWLELPSGTRDQIRAHLEKYVVADRVEVQGVEVPVRPASYRGIANRRAMSDVVMSLPPPNTVPPLSRLLNAVTRSSRGLRPFPRCRLIS